MPALLQTFAAKQKDRIEMTRMQGLRRQSVQSDPPQKAPHECRFLSELQADNELPLATSGLCTDDRGSKTIHIIWSTVVRT